LATNDKDFKIKNGLVVQGATATVNGNDVLTTASDIEDLSNVDTSGVADGNALVYDEASSTWIPGEGGGGGSYTVSTTPPSEPSGGDIWFDSVTGNTYIYYSDYDNDQWVQTSGVDMVLDPVPIPSYIISSTAPESPTNGDFWFDNVTGNIYVYYEDSNTSQWVQTAGPNLVSYKLPIAETAPSDNQILVYNSANEQYEPENFPTSSTANLTDVSSTAPTNNQVLIFNDSTGEYEPGNLPEAPSPIGLILALG